MMHFISKIMYFEDITSVTMPSFADVTILQKVLAHQHGSLYYIHAYNHCIRMTRHSSCCCSELNACCVKKNHSAPFLPSSLQFNLEEMHTLQVANIDKIEVTSRVIIRYIMSNCMYIQKYQKTRLYSKFSNVHANYIVK